MITTRALFYRIFLAVPVIFTLLLTLASCGNKSENNPLTVLSITGGNVQVLKKGSGNWTPSKTGMFLGTGDKIKTDDGSKATVTFFDGSVIELFSSTEISLDELTNKSASSPKIIKSGATNW